MTRNEVNQVHRHPDAVAYPVSGGLGEEGAAAVRACGGGHIRYRHWTKGCPMRCPSSWSGRSGQPRPRRGGAEASSGAAGRNAAEAGMRAPRQADRVQPKILVMPRRVDPPGTRCRTMGQESGQESKIPGYTPQDQAPIHTGILRPEASVGLYTSKSPRDCRRGWHHGSDVCSAAVTATAFLAYARISPALFRSSCPFTEPISLESLSDLSSPMHSHIDLVRSSSGR